MSFRALMLGLVLTAGCANSGTVTEKSPVTQDLGAYRTASIAVTVAPGIENPDVYRSQLGTFLEESLMEQKLFDKLVADGGDLQLKITVTKLDKPLSLGGVPAGETDATSTIELYDTKASKSVGNFDINASSKQAVKTSVNGVNTRTGEDPRKRALQSSADGIAKYIASHRAGSAK
jgi:hypothetical protein